MELWAGALVSVHAHGTWLLASGSRCADTRRQRLPGGGAGQAWAPLAGLAMSQLRRQDHLPPPTFLPSPAAAIRAPIAKNKSAQSAPGATSSHQNDVCPAARVRAVLALPASRARPVHESQRRLTSLVTVP